MAIDPSIALGVHPPQLAPLEIQTPLERFGKVLSLQNLMRQGEMGQLELENARQAQRDDQALRQGWLAVNGDMTKLPQAVMGKVSPKTMISLQQSVNQAKEAAAKLTKAELDNLTAQNSLIADAGQGILTLPEDKRAAAYDAKRNSLIASGKFTAADIPEQYSEDTVRQAIANSVQHNQFLDYEDKKRTEATADLSRMAGAGLIKDQATYDRLLPRLPVELRSQMPADFESGVKALQDLGLTREQQVTTAQAAAGKTVPYPEPVQKQKVETAAAQGLAAKQAELAFQTQTNEAMIQAALADKTGTYYASLPEDKKSQISAELSKRGFTAFGLKPSDVERKVLNYYERSQQAEDLINKVPAATKDNPNPRSLEQIIQDKNLWGQLRLQYAPNAMQTPEGRQYWQALRQFTEARLRKESGAVINPSEYTESQRTYFPAAGDDKATLEQKRNARQGLLESMKTEAGPAYTQKYGAKESGGAQTPARTSTGAAQAAPAGSWPVQVTKPGGKPESMWMGPDGRTYELPPEPTIDTKPSTLKPTHRYNPKTGKIEAIP